MEIPPPEPYTDYWENTLYHDHNEEGNQKRDGEEDKDQGATEDGKPPHDCTPLIPTYRLHTPEEGGNLKVKKLLGKKWARSQFKKYTTLHWGGDCSKQHTLRAGERGPGDIQKLLDAGIIKRHGYKGIPMRPFYLPDAIKKRYRLITDIPLLNRELKGKVRTKLPRVTSNYQKLLNSEWIVALDFQCYYFQLPLNRKSTTYTFRFRGSLFRWNVVPMGAAWSCRVAQEIAEEFCAQVSQLAGCTIWDLTYIDNIYWGVRTEEDAQRTIQVISTLCGRYKAKCTFEYWQRGPVLGVTLDLIAKEVTVLPSYYIKHSPVWNRMPSNLQEFFTWAGVLIRAHYVLRGSLAQIRGLLASLADASRAQATGQAGSWTCADDTAIAVCEAQELTKAGTRANLLQDSAPQDVSLLVYTDASEWGAGAVCVTEQRIWAYSLPWSNDPGYSNAWAQAHREARAGTIVLRHLEASGLAVRGKVLLAVDASCLVMAEKRGLSLISVVNDFVETSRRLQVRLFHVRSARNLADAPSRGLELPSQEEVAREVEALSETYKGSEEINQRPRSKW